MVSVYFTLLYLYNKAVRRFFTKPRHVLEVYCFKTLLLQFFLNLVHVHRYSISVIVKPLVIFSEVTGLSY